MTEELKQKAEEYADRHAIIHTKDVYIEIQDAYIAGATEVTKELQEENKTVSRKANEAIADKLLITAKYNEVLNDLNQENDKLQKQIKERQEENEILERRIVRAKDCMKKLLYVVESEHLNCKGLIQDAEDFIYNRTCNIRKSGNHCITKEPCIMCDRK